VTFGLPIRRCGLLITALALIAGCTDPVPHDGRATVVGVVDGDTIDVTIGKREERIRLIGIDTPETKKPDTPIECFGLEASEFTASLLPVGTAVRIERDIVGRDDYGRLLGYVFLPRGEAAPGLELFVNDEIIRRGYAEPLSIGPNTAYAARFVESARAAESEDLGLWAACSP